MKWKSNKIACLHLNPQTSQEIAEITQFIELAKLGILKELKQMDVILIMNIESYSKYYDSLIVTSSAKVFKYRMNTLSISQLYFTSLGLNYRDWEPFLRNKINRVRLPLPYLNGEDIFLQAITNDSTNPSWINLALIEEIQFLNPKTETKGLAIKVSPIKLIFTLKRHKQLLLTLDYKVSYLLSQLNLALHFIAKDLLVSNDNLDQAINTFKDYRGNLDKRELRAIRSQVQEITQDELTQLKLYAGIRSKLYQPFLQKSSNFRANQH